MTRLRRITRWLRRRFAAKPPAEIAAINRRIESARSKHHAIRQLERQRQSARTEMLRREIQQRGTA